MIQLNFIFCSCVAVETINSVLKICFFDIVVLQLYRITFLLLNIIYLQIEGIAKRIKEVGFVDLIHFLEPPEILHGLKYHDLVVISFDI